MEGDRVMNRQLVTSLVRMDSRKIYRIIAIVLLAWFGIGLIIQVIILSNSTLYNPDLYILDEQTNYVYYTAYPFAKFITACGIPLICCMAWILVGIVPAWQLMKYYTGNPSIYAWLRLPVNKKSLYLVKVMPSILFSIGIWLSQIILLGINYLTYLGLTQKYQKASEQWSQFINHEYIRIVIPLKQPVLFIPLIFLSVLLPAIFFLIMLLIHSKEKRFITVCVLVLGFVAGYSYVCYGIWSVLLVPVATIAVVYRSIYILRKVTIC